MILNLSANISKLMAHFEKVTAVYIKQYGAGNLRLNVAGDVLQQTIQDSIPDGIVQVTATNAAAGNGWVLYFWEGDLWAISDVAGPVGIVAASYQFYIDRLQHGSAPNESVITEGELEGDLSTYRRNVR